MTNNQLGSIQGQVQELVRETSARTNHGFDGSVVVDLVKAIHRFALLRTPKRPYGSLSTGGVRDNLISLRDALEKARIAAWAVNNDSGPGELRIDGQLAEINNADQAALRDQLRGLLSDDVFHLVGPGLTETLGALTYTVDQFLRNVQLVKTPTGAVIGASAPEVIRFIKAVGVAYERCTGMRFTGSDGGRGDGRISLAVVFVQKCWKLAGQSSPPGPDKILSAWNR